MTKIKTEKIKDLQAKAFVALKDKMGWENVMQAPKIQKVIVSCGVGSIAAKDKKKLEIVADRLAKITGQKPAVRAAKKSIASFKLREGEPVGYQVTLRGARLFGFLDKLLNVSLPRTRDFRGISSDSVDEMGNITVGIKENVIFPETNDEELKDVFGLSVTVTTTAKDKKTAKEFFTYLGFPFKKA